MSIYGDLAAEGDGAFCVDARVEPGEVVDARGVLTLVADPVQHAEDVLHVRVVQALVRQLLLQLHVVVDAVRGQAELGDPHQLHYLQLDRLDLRVLHVRLQYHAVVRRQRLDYRLQVRHLEVHVHQNHQQVRRQSPHLRVLLQPQKQNQLLAQPALVKDDLVRRKCLQNRFQHREVEHPDRIIDLALEDAVNENLDVEGNVYFDLDGGLVLGDFGELILEVVVGLEFV